MTPVPPPPTPPFFDPQLMIAVIAAAVLKVAVSPWLGLARTVASIVAAGASAYLFTDPLLYILSGVVDFDGSRVRLAVAGLVGVTGEHLVQHVIGVAKRPDRAPGVLEAIMSMISRASGALSKATKKDGGDKG